MCYGFFLKTAHKIYVDLFSGMHDHHNVPDVHNNSIFFFEEECMWLGIASIIIYSHIFQSTKCFVNTQTSYMNKKASIGSILFF